MSLLTTPFRKRALLAFLLLLGLTGTASADVCAKVKIEIVQELTLERQAFDAHMKVTNGLTSLSIERFGVEVLFTDAAGNEVLASSNPNDTNALFFIKLDSATGVTNVGGTGVIAPGATAEIHWLIIPAPGAAGPNLSGTRYDVGAKVGYRLGADDHEVSVVPDSITVRPMPELHLDYFLPRDVNSDNPFTVPVEPPEPFTLGVRVSNRGHGPANKLKISSSQPRIIENELGLLIAFEIIGSDVNGQPFQPTLLVDFGTIDPAKAGVARWFMTTTLQGRFTEFTATFSHDDALGGELTSLLETVTTHTLVRDVRVDAPGRDARDDFLAIAGSTYKAYESDSVDTPVADASALGTLTAEGPLVQRLTVSPVSGLFVVKKADPYAGAQKLLSAVRSDGKILPKQNAWITRAWRPLTNDYDYWLYVFDTGSSGQSYVLTFGEGEAPNLPPVFQPVTGRTVRAGEMVEILVTAADPEGLPVALTSALLPGGATFTDLGSGIGVFRWTPGASQTGEYVIGVDATDGVRVSGTGFEILVVPADTENGPPTSVSAHIETTVDTPSLPVVPTVIDPDSADKHTFAITSAPAHGTVKLVPGTAGGPSALVFTPAVGYFGSDSFTVTATDPFGQSVTGLVTVKVRVGCPGDPGGDTDEDGRCAAQDNCPSVSNGDQVDGDGDGVGDLCDTCASVPNSSQDDTDRTWTSAGLNADLETPIRFTTSDGALWAGPVHLRPDGTVATLTLDDPESAVLTVESWGISSRELVTRVTRGTGRALSIATGASAFLDVDATGKSGLQLALAPSGDASLLVDVGGATLFSCTAGQCGASGSRLITLPLGLGPTRVMFRVLAGTVTVDDLQLGASAPDGRGDACDNCPGVKNGDQADGDGDGVGNACDVCPGASDVGQADLDHDGAGDACDLDDDGDGVGDDTDVCPGVADAGQLDTDGDTDGDACDLDDDGDGVVDSADLCPLVTDGDQTNLDGDLEGDACDLDDDGDGVPDATDNCPRLAGADQTDTNGDGEGDLCDADDDGDGVLDAADNCTLVQNSGQEDLDGDGVGDLCSADDDGDGVLDGVDNCPSAGNVDQIDTDGDAAGDVCDLDDDQDGVLDGADNCGLVANTDQLDLDGDQAGDLCDLDDDGDGILDLADLCPRLASADQNDLDADGQGAPCDLDDDGDGTPDATDVCPILADPGQVDLDGDGDGDLCDVDDDGDGTPDSADNCGRIANADQADQDGDTAGDLCDADRDGDGVPNTTDRCPTVADPEQADLDGDGQGDLCDADDDGDGLADSGDNCDRIGNADQANLDGDALGDLCDDDDDGDGLLDAADLCPRVASADQSDLDGDGKALPCDDDDDGDGALDAVDVCPTLADPAQADLDGDGDGDLCDDDDDGDNVVDVDDNCPRTRNGDQADLDGDDIGDACEGDLDGDGVADADDGCPTVADPDQKDLDGDEAGDACDPDDDGDDVADTTDNCPALANVDQANLDGDAFGDLCDPDDDGDGTADGQDNCPTVMSASQVDTDGDGAGDPCDDDDDGDGVLDGVDVCPGTADVGQGDLDGDGAGDACDADDDADGTDDGEDNCPRLENVSQADVDQDGIGDACEGDTDGDGVADDTDLCTTIPDPDQNDLDGDLVGDACDDDDDADGVADATDLCPTLMDPEQTDLDGDLAGDACDPDDDGDGVADATDLCPRTADPEQADADGDGVGDACQGDDDGDGVVDVDDGWPTDPARCRDVDDDGCDDCTSGKDDTAADGPDADEDGVCDQGETDDDGDGVPDVDDSAPSDSSACRDVDDDDCDDCTSGKDDKADDGPDADGDGLCDAGDPDDDGDGVPDADDAAPLVKTACRDLDDDGCDDCTSGQDSPKSDGPDLDQDGLCDAGDADDDGDGASDDVDEAPTEPKACHDLDQDDCDDCSSGTMSMASDGADLDGDGLCDAGDLDDDGDGVPDAVDACPAVAGAPGAETCNGQDDDCDGETDEDFALGAACSAGVGECLEVGGWVCGPGGVAVCDAVAGGAGVEACNGLDDDCDGAVDDGFDLGTACVVGVGKCAGVGVRACAANGTVECIGTAGVAVAETCNGADDDCDGETDEELGLGDVCVVGLGTCEKSGVTQCDPDGLVVCSVVAGSAAVESCNGLDDDCDGETDEGFDLGQACEAGEGACASAGVRGCLPDGSAGCLASVVAAGVESCNGLDDDCDGATDEDWDVGAACSAGVGACSRSGVIACVDSGAACSAVPGGAGVETCNSADDDCDGLTDEDWAVGVACVAGLGVCQVAGVVGCFDGGVRCEADVPGALGELCGNGLDDDCDGSVDEGCSCSAGVTCGLDVGACAQGQVLCEDGQLGECSGAVWPVAESCNNIDDDCNGVVDDGCPCGASAGATENCGVDVGECRTGSRTCVIGEWSACDGAVGPSAEACNGLDDDCDGETDEGCPEGVVTEPDGAVEVESAQVDASAGPERGDGGQASDSDLGRINAAAPIGDGGCSTGSGFRGLSIGLLALVMLMVLAVARERRLRSNNSYESVLSSSIDPTRRHGGCAATVAARASPRGWACAEGYAREGCVKYVVEHAGVSACSDSSFEASTLCVSSSTGLEAGER